MPTLGKPGTGRSSARSSQQSTPTIISVLHGLPRYTQDCPKAFLNVLVGSCPRADADPHCSLTLPHGATAPTGSLLLNSGDHLVGGVGITKGHEHLIEHYFVENSVSSRSESVGEPICMAA